MPCILFLGGVVLHDLPYAIICFHHFSSLFVLHSCVSCSRAFSTDAFDVGRSAEFMIADAKTIELPNQIRKIDDTSRHRLESLEWSLGNILYISVHEYAINMLSISSWHLFGHSFLRTCYILLHSFSRIVSEVRLHRGAPKNSKKCQRCLSHLTDDKLCRKCSVVNCDVHALHRIVLEYSCIVVKLWACSSWTSQWVAELQVLV